MIIKKIWLHVLIILSILLVSILIFKQYQASNPPRSEGFTQSQPFVMKTGENAYDDFYTNIYDVLNKPKRRVPYEIKTIVETTQADYDKSTFLDIGSGTGMVVNELTELGFDAYGIDKSNAMVDYSERKYPNAVYKCADAMDPMCFDKGVFTHITCLFFTIYQFENKVTFFRNCYFWLKPGGFLVIHLVDPKKFDVTPPAGKDVIFGSPKRYHELQSRDALVVFNDFKYKASYKYDDPDDHVVLTETFTDVNSNHIRQNEQTLYMESIKDIVNQASYNGFIPHSKIDLTSVTDDENQYLYFFERSL